MAVAAASNGLTEAEARRRVEARAAVPPPTSRSYASIVRANVFTVFNLILLVFGVLTLGFGAWEDALFLAIIAANSTIGIVQEARAKQALDRLAALVAPTAAVVRDGNTRRVSVDEVVEGDLVALEPGDQIVGDGRLEHAAGLTLDESILTGESEPVERSAGDEVRSGSFVVEGTGRLGVTAVGEKSYAARVAGEARAFRHPRSPLERAVNKLLITLAAVLVPLGAILGYALWERDVGFSESVTTAVAAGVTLVPEGLVLLTSLTYAVAAARMARRGALAQQLNAIESLASVDVVCLDKTGTLTEPTLRVVAFFPAPGTDEEALRDALGRYAASASARNATLAAVAERVPGEARPVEGEIPFASRRRWSALRLDGVSYVLGAPELFALDELAGAARREAAAGRRVLALARTEAPLAGEELPHGIDLLGLVVLSERLRPETQETVDYFAAQGVALVVISGDRPETVAAIAADAGIAATGAPLDGTDLPPDPAEVRRLVLERGVVGRISPESKRRVVEALRDGGRYVAMVGDGVNDVPALKAARLGIAQGTGTQMAKTVADLVLVRGEFGAVPPLVAEGRRILRNLQRVTKLFVTKSAFAAFLILSVGLTPTAYPLLPRHLTLAAGLTIGIPSLFLALAPSSGPYAPERFLREVARFALPAGTAAGLGVLSSYLFSLNVVNMPLVEARTVATTVLVLVGLYLILALEAAGRVRGAAVGGLCASLLALYGLVLAVGWTRDFFALAVPGAGGLFIAVVGAAMAVAGLVLTDERFLVGMSFRGRS